MKQLDAVTALLQQREALNNSQYNERASPIRDWAQKLARMTKIDRYPNDLKQFIRDSQYAATLPDRIARVVINSLPRDKNLAMPSSEMGVYRQLVQRTRDELQAIQLAAEKLNLEEIIIPENEISLDISIPRVVFHNHADSFARVLSRFVRVASYFTELTSGSESPPSLTYTSTSDPVTGIALIGTAAWGFLQFYKLALEVAEKQISFLKTLKELRALPVKDLPNLDDQLKFALEESLKRAVESSVKMVPAQVPEARQNEIVIAINKDARVVIEAIANGARVGITVESLDRTSVITAALPNVSDEDIQKSIGEQKALEHKVQDSLNLLGQPAPPLLTSDRVEINRENNPN